MIFEKQPNLPEDLAKLNNDELNTLCGKLRERLVEVVSKNGGHLSSNLGVVELTVALYSVYNPFYDRIVWDVGHQTYVHKILTGRDDEMESLRRKGGISGFPKRMESDADSFNVGHSSTSISAALGLARAYKLKGEDRKVVAIIGDGALTGGMAYEALNDVSQSKLNMVVILNDNGMSINPNVGGLSKYLNRIRSRQSYFNTKKRVKRFLDKLPLLGTPIANLLNKIKTKLRGLVVQGKFFEDLGFYYLGPVNGHDISALKKMLIRANESKDPVIVHVMTKKGMGYKPAEERPDKFHGVGGFDSKTGEVPTSKDISLSSVFSDTLSELAIKDDKIVGITAAMASGTGLDKFGQNFPSRVIDVGIAEQHAVTMAAGMSAGGAKPVVAIYSTFMQRAFDQLLHDVALQKLPLVVTLDRAGVCGYDGETHHGIYDFSYLSGIPDAIIGAPSSKKCLEEMIRLAFHVYDEKGNETVLKDKFKSLFAIRYPAKDRFTEMDNEKFIYEPVAFGKGSVCFKSEATNNNLPKITIISIGEMLEECFLAASKLSDEGYGVTLFDARFLFPIDEQEILNVCNGSDIVITAEDAIGNGGLGEKVENIFYDNNVKVQLEKLHVTSEIIGSDSIRGQLASNGLTWEEIVKSTKQKAKSIASKAR